MIHVEQLTKEFKIFKKQPGFTGALKGLVKREAELITAVDDISFNIERGEIVGYIGANGAGKSTTIKMMCGILNPTKGKILINGIVPYENRIQNARNIGVVFGQRTQLWWDLALGETFSILKEIYDVNDADYKERMGYFSEILGIDEFMRQPVRTLSLGQRMRADLAASMIHNPKILYLDEPTIGLDVLVKEKMRQAVKELNERFDTTVILTTHDMSDIEKLCSRLIIIDQGKKIYDGDKQSIAAEFGQKRVLEIDLKSTELEHETIKHFLMSKDSSGEMTLNGTQLSIAFDQNQLAISELITVVMNHASVQDFRIKETNIEEIAKSLYKGGKTA